MSSEMEVLIQEVNQPTTITYNKLSIRCIDYQLHTSAKFLVSKYNDDTLIENQMLIMKDADFDAWGTDDDYVKTWVAAQLSVTPIA